MAILHKGFWPTVGHLVHTIAARGGCNGSIFPTTRLTYRSAIYPQGMTFKYGLGLVSVMPGGARQDPPRSQPPDERFVGLRGAQLEVKSRQTLV